MHAVHVLIMHFILLFSGGRGLLSDVCANAFRGYMFVLDKNHMKDLAACKTTFQDIRVSLMCIAHDIATTPFMYRGNYMYVFVCAEIAHVGTATTTR